MVVLDGLVIGTGGLGWIGQRSSDGKWIGDAGMMITPAQRGKGYAYEALRMILDYGYRVLIMDEIHVSCVDKNDAFKSLMNVKFGFSAAPCQDKFGNNWIWRIRGRRGCRVAMLPKHSIKDRPRLRIVFYLSVLLCTTNMLNVVSVAAPCVSNTAT